MNAAILIAGRELRDRSRLFLIAIVLAVIPFIASLTLRDHRHTGMAMTATFLAVGYAAVVALMLGISAIGRELSENRGSFLFARPVSPAAIWFGKTAAAIVICLNAFFIVALPTYTLARDGWRDLWGRGGLGALYAVILCVALFFGGHVASTMLRSRSSRVLLDGAFLVLAMVALIAILRPMLAVGGGNVALKVMIGIGIALLAVFLAAPVWQLAQGRIDPLRNHVALSAVLWVAVAIILVVAAAYVLWVLSPPLASLTHVYALDQSPTGEWVFVVGFAPGRGSLMTSYLIHSKSGQRGQATAAALTVTPAPRVHLQGMIVGEVGDARLLVLTKDHRLRIVDRATGNVEVEVTGVSTPILGRARPIPPRYTDDATFVGIGRDRRYLLWDARTGAKRPFPS